MSGRNKVKIYAIILTTHGKMVRTVCSAKTEKEIYKEYNRLLKESKSVMLPVRYNNLKHVMVPAEYELVIIKCKQEGDKDVTQVRDDSGRYVNYETDNEDWIVVDRGPYDVEETFWVYGYHPRLRRKDFRWIMENIFEKNVGDKYYFKTVVAFANKLLVDTPDGLEMVICKNRHDCIRMYNLAEDICMKRKYRNVLFMGLVDKGPNRKRWFDKIRELTNWNDVKINRTSTRP